MMSRNSVRLRVLGHALALRRLRAEHRHGPISCGLHASRTPRGKETKMNRLVLLIPLVLACSSRPLGSHALDGSYPELGGSGGKVVPPASGGASGNGGAGGNMGGANMGSGGIIGAGGAAGRGGAPGSVDGSPDAQACGTRVPANHRAMEGAPCPSDRAPGGGIPPRCVFDGGPSDLGKCRQDSDCTAGINGRCFEHGDCYMMCSYDECFQDSDCPGNVPCSCRDSASSTANNWCLADSNCRVDDDCGPCGYCSPSQLSGCVRMCTVPCETGSHCYAGTTEVPCSCSRSCGEGYFCRTADDTCTNDRECTADSACTRQLAGGWACIPCAQIP